jgi:cytoskeletal protein CcmA (bactofilin family)
MEGVMRFGFSKSRRKLDGLANGDVVALLASGIEVEGTLKLASGWARLDCRFKGEISSEGTIVVGDGGDVEANIHARQVSIAGKVKGNVRASECLELKENAVLLGDVETPALVIDPGAHFGGHCHMPAFAREESTPNPVDPSNFP